MFTVVGGVAREQLDPVADVERRFAGEVEERVLLGEVARLDVVADHARLR